MIVGIECKARCGYSSSCRSLEKAMADTTSNGTGLTRDSLDGSISGSPVRKTSGDGSELFVWNGALQSYRIRLRYTKDGHVVSMNTE